jgi:hypothetical protein
VAGSGEGVPKEDNEDEDDEAEELEVGEKKMRVCSLASGDSGSKR